MASVLQAIVCPACQTRNKLKWEFCARCGEPLPRADEVALAEAPEPSASEPEEIVDAATGSPWIAIGLLVAAVAGGGLAFSWRPTPDRVDPGLFSALVARKEPPTATLAERPLRPGESELIKGRDLLARGETLAALEHLSRAVDEDSSVPEYHLAYAEALMRQAQIDRALAHYRTAAMLAPDRYRKLLADQLNLAGRRDEAVREYRAILASNADNVDALEQAGWLLADAERYPEAVPLLTRASELRPGRAAIWRRLGWAAEKSGDLDRAAKAYGNAVAREPGTADGRTRLAEVLVEQGKVDQALAVYREGIRVSPGEAILHLRYAAVLEQAGRFDEAAAQYREYARLAPGAENAQAATERAQQLEEKSDSGT